MEEKLKLLAVKLREEAQSQHLGYMLTDGEAADEYRIRRDVYQKLAEMLEGVLHG